MNNRILGLIAMVGAPFLFIDFCIHGQNGGGEQFEHTSLSGIFSIIYISAWMCSMVGLKNIHAAGNSRNGSLWMTIPLVTLSGKYLECMGSRAAGSQCLPLSFTGYFLANQ